MNGNETIRLLNNIFMLFFKVIIFRFDLKRKQIKNNKLSEI